MGHDGLMRRVHPTCDSHNDCQLMMIENASIFRGTLDILHMLTNRNRTDAPSFHKEMLL